MIAKEDQEMPVEKIDTLVVGAGQAGIAMSQHLNNQKVPHIVLERDRIAQQWRTGRWDSLVANGPAWHDRFPGLEFSVSDGEAFAPKEEVADYFVACAKKFDAPVRTGVAVTSVTRTKKNPVFASKPRMVSSKPSMSWPQPVRFKRR
jgi:putative flavoprotein involved in K+ transport